MSSCVTRWSKFGTTWRGVSLDTLFEDVESEIEYTMVHSYGGYTTTVPLDDLLDDVGPTITCPLRGAHRVVDLESHPDASTGPAVGHDDEP